MTQHEFEAPLTLNTRQPSRASRLEVIKPIGTRDWRGFLLTTLLVVVSGNTAVWMLPKEVVLVGALACTLAVWWPRRTAVLKQDWYIVLAFLSMSILHVAEFGLSVGVASAGFMVRLLTALLAIRAVPRFWSHYVRLMYGLAILSLIFYVPVVFGVDLPNYLAPLWVPFNGTELRHVVLHNFMQPGGEERNAGMFGEPGMFAGYLVLSWVAAIITRRDQRKMFWLTTGIALLSTQSTTGYAAGMLVAMAWLWRPRPRSERFRMVRKGAVAAGLAILFLYSYEHLPFLGEKIEHQWDEARSRTSDSRITRFGALLYDLDHIEQRPLAGWSPNPRTRTSVDLDFEDVINGQGNGISNFASKFGMIGLGIYLATAWRQFKDTARSPVLAAWAWAVLIVLLMGEAYLNGSLFLTVMFQSNFNSEA